MECSSANKRMKMEPRKYQIDAVERAIKENTILYLDTGTGKTYIAVLLLDSVKERLASTREKRIGVFLAPTVNLVIQQARVLSTMCELKVGVYYGAKGVDAWSVSQWQEELNSHQVFVMTPQVFLNTLNTSALSMKTVELLIIDECHHAQKNHPSALIMKIHYHNLPSECKPKVFGMTASPIIGKGITAGCSLKLSQLENTLDSRVYTLKAVERTELEAYAPTPNHIIKEFQRSTYNFSPIKSQLETLLFKYADHDNIPCIDYSFGDVFKFKEKVESSVRTLHSTIEFILTDLGILAVSMAVDVLLRVDKKQRSYICDMSIEKTTQRELEGKYKNSYLQEVSLVFSPLLEGPKLLWETTEGLKYAKEQGIVTSKVELLMQILRSYRTVENLRCIVFVERVIVSMVLAKMIGQLDFLEFVHCDYVAGVNADLCSKTPSEQQETLDKFADGKVNVLIATSVAEEGLDIQSCSSVIRFDLCQTLRSHIQSRGRARRHGSEYTWLIESGNIAQEEQLFQMSESEKLVKNEALSRDGMDFQRQVPVDRDLEVFRVDSGACRSTEDSVSFIYQYCGRLPGDRYYNPKPEFTFSGAYTCTLHFPPSAPLDAVQGPWKHTEQLAKKAACLKACQELYDIGAVRKDTLCPDVEEKETEEEHRSEVEGSSKGKPRELFSSIRPAALEGSTLKMFNQMQVQLYVIVFSADTPLDEYASFALVTEGHLHEDVVNSETNLYLTRNRVVTAKLLSFGQTELNMEQLAAARDYQELLFNAAFGRFDVEDDHRGKAPWNDAYLLLPLNNDKTIDWKGIYSTAEAHRLLLSGLPTQMDSNNSSSSTSDHCMVYTAGGLQPLCELENSVVVTIHSGKIFCITGVLNHLTASAFPGKKAASYIQYFMDKYNKQLKFLDQPLLEAKQTHTFHNLLASRSHESHSGREALVKERRVELPPELCLVLGLNPSVISSLYLLPSYMFRLTAAVCASQLSMALSKAAPRISTLQVLEALTSKKCQQNTSYERLELLGDSFLKYAITRRLFLVFSNKHEGQLTARRSQATCNATLSNLATRHGFPAYICDEAFEPSYWTGPGMHIPEALVCKHDAQSASDEAQARKCIEGHRWIRSKVTADVVEALVGASLVSSGPEGALEFMKALGFQVEVGQHLIQAATQMGDVKESSLAELEQKLGYRFQNKTLLLEAITHASHPFTKLCYQRLEFLGDGAIDFLLSQHFFKSYPGLPPGVLTDLRSAAVNNGCFARVAVRQGLHLHLRHSCDELHRDIMLFAKSLEEDLDGPQFGFGSIAIAAPKVLGDLVESIAGAILVDTGFNLEELWKVMIPLLSPLVTPDNLVYHPVRELGELCSSKKLSLRWGTSEPGTGLMTVQVIVTVGDREFLETGNEKNKKAAKQQAAQRMLAAIRLHFGDSSS